MNRVDAALAAIAAAVSGEQGPAPRSELIGRLERILDPADLSSSYLVLGMLRARIPSPTDVVSFGRRWALDGLSTAVKPELRAARRGPLPRIESRLLVDVSDTSRSPYTTGIQRVARESIARWERSTEIVPVRFDRGRGVLRTVADDQVVLPFRSRFVLPEIAVERERSRSIASIARFSASRTMAIGFDCIPMTTAETCGPGMPGEFAHYLSTLAHFDTVAPISTVSGDEFRGWRRMLVGAGLAGPEIVDVALPFAVGEPADLDVRRELALAADEPLVVVVGSHEPRKNHLRLLEACELVWRRGRRFTLVMVGGNAWSTERFVALRDRLRSAGRAIVTRSTATDDEVWGLYRAASVTAFVSLNEGFGLPLAESLAAGVPAVTSDFGSMADLGGGRGAVLVDPRSPDQIADALDAVLSDPEYRAELAGATQLPSRSWDDYADDLLTLVPSAPATA
ncbi:glycosyltransferase [Homoserinibacter sp. GY 40078]|uniref:glycosyltransferase n=1 Tax=Homoserinibacter sp. GY 40078 TaxID=2603275 RepID=UPI00164FF14F|nr:glycosyltransferase [Homoserinibacter sp. GY 40078]